ncbi:carboxypeptidase-like regulatory domain-containing protein [Chitinispirillales bacterium ANBcel5]|uniref:carboxypeptidase-like regulatory domain-containing protein n=1 Tax=Cellulosispirillum alkaliphilum TaxID=3039283 RepID=UPI002A5014A8|nr:carboxypeptidase-like regulatory domain-containing protein [Chitinispirillales bacterium ANBcel5]
MNQCLKPLLVLIILLLRCGGISDHGNARIAGIIADENGYVLSGVEVTLLKDSYNPITDTNETPVVTTTNYRGYYEFSNLPQSVYSITGINEKNGHAFLKKGISLLERLEVVDSLNIRAPGRINLNPDELELPDSAALYIPGSMIWREVLQNSVFLSIPVPPGSVTLKGFDLETGKETYIGPEFDEIVVESGYSLVTMHKSTTPRFVGEDGTFYNEMQGYVDSVYSVTAAYPIREPANEYMYRFSWGDGAVTNRLYGPVQSYSWSEPGIYQIKTQESRENSLLQWSEPILINIVLPQD